MLFTPILAIGAVRVASVVLCNAKLSLGVTVMLSLTSKIRLLDDEDVKTC